MMTLLLLLLSCSAPSDPASTPEALSPSPCTWTEDACFSPPVPLDGEILQVMSCTDTEDGYTVCAPQGWRIHPDGSWEPSTCTGDYWRACIVH